MFGQEGFRKSIQLLDLIFLSPQGVHAVCDMMLSYAEQDLNNPKEKKGDLNPFRTQRDQRHSGARPLGVQCPAHFNKLRIARRSEELYQDENKPGPQAKEVRLRKVRGSKQLKCQSVWYSKRPTVASHTKALEEEEGGV